MSLKVLIFHTHYTFICCVTHSSGVDNPTYFIFGSESYTTSKFNCSPNKHARTTKRTHGKPKVAQVAGGWLAFTPVQLAFSPHSQPLCPTVLWGFSDLKGPSVMGRSTAIRNQEWGASLVAQWLRICMPVQGTRVWALVWEDPTCRGASGPVSHNYRACASGACAPQQESPG